MAMMNSENRNYRDFLLRYAETTRLRRPGFTIGSWAKAMGLKSTSSLSKILQGEREAGPEMVDRMITYFKFSKSEADQFRKLVALSKMKENEELKSSLIQSLLDAQLADQLKSKRSGSSLESRLMELAQFELLSSCWNLAIRELTRLPKMKPATLMKLLPEVSAQAIERGLKTLQRLSLVARKVDGSWVAKSDHVHTPHEFPNDAIRTYHEQCLDLAKSRLATTTVEQREYQSLVFLVDSKKLPELKETIRKFLDTFESEQASPEVDQLYQLQLQFYPVSKAFEAQTVSQNSTQGRNP